MNVVTAISPSRDCAGSVDRSVATSVPGQSGQPLSPHYADLLPLWATGRYFPLLYSRERIEAESREKLILEPREKAP
jgi:penicillin amidase